MVLKSQSLTTSQLNDQKDQANRCQQESSRNVYTLSTFGDEESWQDVWASGVEISKRGRSWTQ